MYGTMDGRIRTVLLSLIVFAVPTFILLYLFHVNNSCF
jgi:hypothetical protein